MSVNTKGKIPSNPSIEKIKSAIEEISYNSISKIYSRETNEIDKSYKINFDYLNKEENKIENRSIFIIVNNIDFPDKSDSDFEDLKKIEGMYIEKPFVYLDLGMSNSAIEIITKIIEYFGGYIIESDSKDEFDKDYIKKILKKKSLKKDLINSLNEKNINKKIIRNNIEINEVNFGY